MRDILTIALEAHNDVLNRHRRYEVHVELDLLDHWLVTIRFGRVGEGARELRFGCASVVRARTIVRDHLRRRLSATRRIGCPYRVRALSAPFGALDVWIPADLLSRLLRLAP